MLLQVLEEASIAEVIDMSTEKHQLWVDVIRHTVVGGHCVANNGWHNEGGGTVTYAVPTAFYQGTKSGKSKNIGRQSKSPSNCLRTEKTCLLFMLNVSLFFFFFFR